MIKRAFAILLFLILCLLMLPSNILAASKSNYSIQDEYVYTVVGGKAVITAYNGDHTDIIIPSTLGGYPVTSIYSNPFGSNRKYITSITIPDSIKTLPSGVFDFLSNLKSIKIGNGLKTISKEAFSHCSNLESVTIPDSVRSIGESAFSDCTNLKSITIPDSVTSIGENAFDNCKNLNSVYISDLAAWCKISFSNNNSNPLYYAHDLYLNNTLVENLVVPNGISNVGDNIFSGCLCLKNVTIPDCVTSIGENAFARCLNLKSITIPDSVASIGENAFDNCKNLNSVYISDLAAWCKISFSNYNSNPLYYAHDLYLNNTLVEDLVVPDGVANIGDRSFEHCRCLKSVTIPDSVTSIGENAFARCLNLKSITIPDSVASIGENAFSDYSIFTADENGFVIVNGLLCDYFGSEKNVTIPDNVTCIGENAFIHNECINSITLPSNAISIRDGAFTGCCGLADENGFVIVNGLLCDYFGFDKNITIPTSVKRIAVNAFYSYSDLISITIPTSVTSIGEDAFYNCTNLNSVYISDLAAWCNISFCDYDSNPLCYAYNLYLNNALVENLVIPEGVTNVGDYAFENCRCLKSVTIPDSVTSIGKNAFDECENLNAVYISDLAAWCNISFGQFFSNPLNYAHNLYFNNTLVEDLVVPDGVTSIQKGLFLDCKNLTNVTIPEGVTSIEDSAFNRCTNLKSITIPKSLTSIGELAFAECENLNDVYISDLAAWCNIEFPSIPHENLYLNGILIEDLVVIPYGVTSIRGLGSKNLTNVIIPEGVTNIEDHEFNGCTNLKSITIPKSLTSIGERAFIGCKISDIYYGGTESQWNAIQGIECSGILQSAEIHFESPVCAFTAPDWAWNDDFTEVTATANIIAPDSNFTVPTGVTLDLAGYSLTADAVMIANGGCIKDSIGSGKLIGTLVVTGNNGGVIPVQTDGSYTFYDIGKPICEGATYKKADSSNNVAFVFDFASAIQDQFAAWLTADSNLAVKISGKIYANEAFAFNDGTQKTESTQQNDLYCIQYEMRASSLLQTPQEIIDNVYAIFENLADTVMGISAKAELCSICGYCDTSDTTVWGNIPEN